MYLWYNEYKVVQSGKKIQIKSTHTSLAWGADSPVRVSKLPSVPDLFATIKNVLCFL